MWYQYQMLFLVTLATCLIPLASAEEAAVDAVPVFEESIHALVEVYCTDCHNPDDLKGDLDLERFETTGMVIDSLAVWQRIAKRIEANEMPPKKGSQPSPEERTQILEWIASL